MMSPGTLPNRSVSAALARISGRSAAMPPRNCFESALRAARGTSGMVVSFAFPLGLHRAERGYATRLTQHASGGADARTGDTSCPPRSAAADIFGDDTGGLA